MYKKIAMLIALVSVGAVQASGFFSRLFNKSAKSTAKKSVSPLASQGPNDTEKAAQAKKSRFLSEEQNRVRKDIRTGELEKANWFTSNRDKGKSAASKRSSIPTQVSKGIQNRLGIRKSSLQETKRALKEADSKKLLQ